MNTTQKIIASLKKIGIENWYLTERIQETTELFFIKKQLDTRRIKDTHKYKVTVFRDEEQDGVKLRGFTDAEILSSDSDKGIENKLNDAYFAAQFALNPYYELPDPAKAPHCGKKGPLAEEPLAVSAGKMAEALFKPDNRGDSFVNSAEIFISRVYVRIMTSSGTDVSYTDADVTGEYVVQCREPEDVEMFHEFAYTECDTEALSKAVAEALSFAADRAKAQKVLKSGKYDVILCGKEAAEVLSYYCERANASMVYARYSPWKVGDNVQDMSGTGVTGEKLGLTLCATVPYSGEGIPMEDIAIIQEGKLENIYGANRYCRYLGIKPTGNYSKLRCDNKGTLTFDEMKKRPGLWAVAFSDFQMDSFSGHFGGEIRLAYLNDGEKVIPITGGSINGSLIEAQSDIAFSEDRFSSSEYDGPYAMMMKNISIAGCD